MPHRIILASLFLSLAALGANFPGELTGTDIESANLKLAGTIEHRPWSLSSKKPKDSVEFSIGLESSMTFNTDLNQYGDGKGRAPSSFPVPKLYADVAFYPDINVSASVLPGMAGITTFGLAGQWFFYRDPNFLSYSVLLHYSHTNLFNDYEANTQGLQVTGSHDFKQFAVYGGAGFISVESRVRSELLAQGTDDKYYGSFEPHFVLGTKIAGDFPVSVQTELIRTELSFGIMVAKDF